MRFAVVFLISLVYGSSYASQPLFDSDDVLAVTIEAPMRELIRHKLKKLKYDATVTVTDPAGNVHSLPAALSARGNARLEACTFPPLRLEFGPDDTRGTPFEGQKRLKMVTHCGRGAERQTWLQQEYGIYRAYNAITDYSYRVREFDVTYRDSTSERWTRTSAAFVIESTDSAAERLGLVSTRPPQVKAEQLQLTESTNNLLFQLLIGNTDFSVKRGPSGEGCCHNGRVIAPEGSQASFIVLPYDFDQAGIINTSYALPDERLGIKRVTSRLYRGFCWQNGSLPAAIARFNEKREEITSALVPEDARASKQKRARRFIDDFYEIINDPGELAKRLTAKCRGPAAYSIRKTRTAAQ